ncbi:hypothetical protein ACFXTN_035868 [Malus domestica]
MADFNVSLEKAKFFLQSQYHDEEKWALNMTPCAPGAWREILARGACNMTAEHRHNNPHDVVRSRGASRGPYNLLGSYGTRLADLAPCCRMAHTCHIGSERQRERILSIPRRGFLI